MADNELNDYLTYLTYRGAEERYGIPVGGEWTEVEHVLADDEPDRIIHNRLDHELEVIIKAGFPSYFLITYDILRFCRERGIPVGPGRGSVCGSAVAFCLRITDVDPIQFGIPFERFLHLERVAQPDIDTDLCQARRGEVIQYIRDTYGHVAQIATFGTLMAKGLMRDLGRILKFGASDYLKLNELGEKLAGMIPEGNGPDQVWLDDFLLTPEGAKFQILCDHEAVIEYRGRRIEALDVARRLEGVRRHGSSHAAGVVIADRPLVDLVPLFKKNKDAEVQIQFDYKDAEEIGLLKMDLLGLRTVTVMGEAEKLIREFHNPDFTLKEVPLDDAPTYRLLSVGDTVGVFQLEGEGITAAVRGIRPDRFYDIVAILALYRPGPMEQLGTYIARKHGEEPVSFAFPILESVLDRTYGLIVFQEQVMGIARALAGYTPGEADLFRKAIGKKIPELIRTELGKFSERAVANGYAPDVVAMLAKQIDYFGRYGFNLGHATGYGFITYWTAYLKANYPTEFYIATLNSHLGEQERIGILLLDAEKKGVKVLCPDINGSGRGFSWAGDSLIRFGIEAVKGIGEKVVQDILEERDSTEKNQYGRVTEERTKSDGRKYKASIQAITRVSNSPRAFAGLWDFCARLSHITITAKRALVAAGAFGEALEKRAGLLACIEELNTAAKAGKLYNWEKMSQSPELFKPGEMELIRAEREVLGFYVSHHPLESLRSEIARYGAVCDGSFDSLPKTCAVAGVITTVKTHPSKNGEMAWLELETNIRDLPKLTLFADVWDMVAEVAKPGEVILVRGKKEQHPKFGWSIIASEAFLIDRTRPRCGALAVSFPETDMSDLAQLKILMGNSGVELYVVVEDRGRIALLKSDRRIALSGARLTDLEALSQYIRFDPPRRGPYPWQFGHLYRKDVPFTNGDSGRVGVWDLPMVSRASQFLEAKVVAELEIR